MLAERIDQEDRTLHLFQYSCSDRIARLPRYPGTPLSRFLPCPAIPVPLCPMICSTPITPYPPTPEDSLCESS